MDFPLPASRSTAWAVNVHRLSICFDFQTSHSKRSHFFEPSTVLLLPIVPWDRDAREPQKAENEVKKSNEQDMRQLACLRLLRLVLLRNNPLKN